MPTVRVTRRVTFNAAHRLHNPAQSDEWNRETYGKCNSPNGHGHNYVLEVTVEGSPDPDTGYVIDLGIWHCVMIDDQADSAHVAGVKQPGKIVG